MDEFDAIILGIIQGLTEFLPVSSSGHIELGKHILGNNLIDDENILFTIVLHFATALSTTIIFRHDISKMMSGLFKFFSYTKISFSKKSFKIILNKESKFLLKIIISMPPVVLVGLFFEQEIESLFFGNIFLVGLMLIFTGFLLWLTSIIKQKKREISYINALIIGIAQAVALIPGISRSGATISTSLILGNKKNDVARFSFLMVIPVILGKILYDFLFNEIVYENIDLTIFFIGFVSAFITGLFACKWMIRLVKDNNLKYFTVYCIVIGVISVVNSV